MLMYSLPNTLRSVLESACSDPQNPLGITAISISWRALALVLLLMASAQMTLMECIGIGSGMVVHDCFEPHFFNLHLLEA